MHLQTVSGNGKDRQVTCDFRGHIAGNPVQLSYSPENQDNMDEKNFTVQRFYYCPKCAGSLKYSDHRGTERLTCTACGYIFYENPIVGVAGILISGKREILLGRRKNGAYAGMWCIPCGYLEYHEDIREGLRREFREETGLDIVIAGIAAAQSNSHDSDRHTVGIWFYVEATGGAMKAGDDLDMLGYFDLYKIPELAFPTDMEVINILKRKWL